MKTDADHGGPSVDSDDRDERIAARRLRIEQRKEAQKRYVRLNIPCSFGHTKPVTVTTRLMVILTKTKITSQIFTT